MRICSSAEETVNSMENYFLENVASMRVCVRACVCGIRAKAWAPSLTLEKKFSPLLSFAS